MSVKILKGEVVVFADIVVVPKFDHRLYSSIYWFAGTNLCGSPRFGERDATQPQALKSLGTIKTTKGKIQAELLCPILEKHSEI